MEFFVLHEGTFAINKNKDFTLFDSETQNKADFKGSVFLNVQPFVIKTDTDVILLDTGVGTKTKTGKLILIDQLNKIGIQPTDITKVLMSHLHKDHVGAMVNYVNNAHQLTFPKAKYYISKPEWDWVHELNSTHYNYEAFYLLLQSGAIHFFEGNGKIDSCITYEVTGGHTPFHTIFHIVQNNEHILYGGDILTMTQQIGSSLLVKSDKFPREANIIRQKIVDRAISEQWMCLFYHGSSTKFGKIVLENQTYRVV